MPTSPKATKVAETTESAAKSGAVRGGFGSYQAGPNTETLAIPMNYEGFF